MNVLAQNDKHRPSYRALVDALAEEFTYTELTQIASAIASYEIDVGSTAATDTLRRAVQEVIDRP